MAPSLNLLPNLHRAGLVVQPAPMSFRRRFLLLIDTFLSYLSIVEAETCECQGRDGKRRIAIFSVILIFCYIVGSVQYLAHV